MKKTLGSRKIAGVKYLIGIDEVGRGPLAGPVAVGAFLAPIDFDLSFFKGIRDSKKLPPHRREYFLNIINEKKKEGEISYAVSFVSSSQIDTKGLSYAIKKALITSIKKLQLLYNFSEDECVILLDGGLKAPRDFLYQETIIKGDDKEPIISLASVAAKVLRDRQLIRISKKYPEYEFHINKGYGTRFHREKILKHGPCPLHRRSFLRNLGAAISI